MPKYKVTITTTFQKEIEIEDAENEREARVLTWDAIEDGSVIGTETDNFETEITEVREVQ